MPRLQVVRGASIGRVVQALLLSIAGLVLLIPGAGAAGAQVRILEPTAGATVNAASVPVALAVEGANLPGDAARWPGLFHVALDGVDVLQTPELRFTLLAVPPGAHRLRVTLEGANPPMAPAEIRFTAQVVSPPAGASWLGAGGVAVAAAVMLVALLVLWLFWVRPQRIEELPAAPGGAAPDPGAPDESIELEPPPSR